MVKSSGKDDFIAKLKEKNIDLILRYTSEGRIYGATFIDHNTMTVLNGSRLGREFSANALERWFNGDGQKPIVATQQPDVDRTQENGRTQENDRPNNQGQSTSAPQPPNPRQDQPNRGQQSSNTQSGCQSPSGSRSQSQSSSNSQSHSNDYDQPTLPGLDLFQVGPGYDPQEEAFYRAMQRRKKKKRRRGPKL